MTARQQYRLSQSGLAEPAARKPRDPELGNLPAQAKQSGGADRSQPHPVEEGRAQVGEVGGCKWKGKTLTPL